MLSADEIFTDEDVRLNEILANIPEAEDDYFPEGMFSSDQADGNQASSPADFLEEARKLVDAGEAKTMTEAMRKVRRQRPELHEAFKAEAAINAGQQSKQNQEFVELCRRHGLCLEQADRARKAGHAKIADGVLRVASDILVRIRKLTRQE